MSDRNDPPRFTEGEPSPLGDLFAAARGEGPTADELGKLAASLEPTFVTPMSVGRIGLLKVTLGSVIGVLALTGGWYALHRSPQVEAPRAPQLSAPPPAPSAAPPAVPPSQAIPPAAPTPSVAPSSKPVTLESESALLERARRELNGNPSRALALANEHARRFPRGMLSQEREVIAIAALRHLGRSTEADQRAARFDRSYPNSAHQRTVDGNPR